MVLWLTQTKFAPFVTFLPKTCPKKRSNPCKKVLACLLATYLAKFLPNLATVCKRLRELKLRDAVWCWLPVHDENVQRIESFVCEAPVSKFYDVSWEVKILKSWSTISQSTWRLLISGGWASYVCFKRESGYAHIEKELRLLSLVFACERLDKYLSMVETKCMLKQIISPLKLWRTSALLPSVSRGWYCVYSITISILSTKKEAWWLFLIPCPVPISTSLLNRPNIAKS